MSYDVFGCQDPQAGYGERYAAWRAGGGACRCGGGCGSDGGGPWVHGRAGGAAAAARTPGTVRGVVGRCWCWCCGGGDGRVVVVALLLLLLLLAACLWLLVLLRRGVMLVVRRRGSRRSACRPSREYACNTRQQVPEQPDGPGAMRGRRLLMLMLQRRLPGGLARPHGPLAPGSGACTRPTPKRPMRGVHPLLLLLLALLVLPGQQLVRGQQVVVYGDEGGQLIHHVLNWGLQ